jgi:hypothetical protein
VFQVPQTVEIADGTYPAVIEAIVPHASSFGEGRKWSFLVEHDGTIDSISAITSLNAGPRSKAGQWLAALYGRPLKAGEVIEDPTGTRCLVTISHNEKGFPTVSGVAQYQEPQQELPGIPR